MLFCVHLLASLVLFFYVSFFVLCFFVLVFFAFFVTFYLHTKSALPWTKHYYASFRPHVVNGQPTLDERAESAGARPLSSPLSVFFFCSRASESFTLIFFKRDDGRDVISRREVVSTIRTRLTQRDFLSPRLKIMHTHAPFARRCN